MSFPYLKHQSGIYFPIIPLSVSYNNHVEKTSALVDSGATTSIFQISIAKRLGIDVEKGQPVFMRGVAGRVKGYRHTVEITVANRIVSAAVIFSEEYLVSLNLLGRESFRSEEHTSELQSQFHLV